MPGKRPSREERELWRGAMRDVKAWRKTEPEPEETPAPPAQQKKEPTRRPRTARPAPVAVPETAKPVLTPGAVIGVDRRLADRLKRGRLPIDATLDLHGLTQSEAHAAVQGFVARAAERGRRTLLIVTGKGRRDGVGVLKSALPRWLNEAPVRDDILALAEARPEHGGSGAFYVLLRRRKRPS
jgi:DNA-nicking Smr family endonuclease